MKASARHQAAEEGKPLPPWSERELLELYRDDLELVNGHGVIELYRTAPGWQDRGQEGGGQEMLDEWEQDARKRLALVDEIGVSLREVYEEHA
jgi:hypothetical protein